MVNDIALIRTDLVLNNNVTCEGLTVYALLSLQTSIKDPSVITTNSLLSYLLCQDDKNKTIKNGIVRGIQNLQDLNLIKVEDKTKTIKIITILDKKIKKNEYYIQLTKDELFNIFTSNSENLCLFKLFKVYLLVLSSFHRDKRIPQKFKGKFCIMSQYYFQDTLKIKPSTFRKYIDWFITNKILYIGSAVLRLPDGTLNHNVSTVYSKYKDKDLINDYIKVCVGYVVDKKEIDNKNYKAKMGLYYHNYMKRGYKLSYEDLMKLLKFCENSNDDKYDAQLLNKKIKEDLKTNKELADQQIDYDLLYGEY